MGDKYYLPFNTYNNYLKSFHPINDQINIQALELTVTVKLFINIALFYVFILFKDLTQLKEPDANSYKKYEP